MQRDLTADQIVTAIDHSVSHLLDDWSVTNQKQSGRCWLFAGLNLLRAGASKKLEVKDFEFSQNYLLFWDKFEKANHWLESIIQTADRDLDDRTVAHLLSSPAEDGGQWNMFVALVAKHGLVPNGAMPETQSSNATAAMNTRISRKKPSQRSTGSCRSTWARLPAASCGSGPTRTRDFTATVR